jgi:hypothetical protein
MVQRFSLWLESSQILGTSEPDHLVVRCDNRHEVGRWPTTAGDKASLEQKHIPPLDRGLFQNGLDDL